MLLAYICTLTVHIVIPNERRARQIDEKDSNYYKGQIDISTS